MRSCFLLLVIGCWLLDFRVLVSVSAVKPLNLLTFPKLLFRLELSTFGSEVGHEVRLLLDLNWLQAFFEVPPDSLASCGGLRISY